MVLVFPGERIRLLSSSSPEGKDGEEDFEEIECGSGAYRDENGIKRASKIGEIYVKDVFEDDVLAVDEEDEDEENDEEREEEEDKKEEEKSGGSFEPGGNRGRKRARSITRGERCCLCEVHENSRKDGAVRRPRVRRETFENGV